ncbi:hypothetical protein Tco_0417767 [Tanacetum coccineum]
MLFVFHVAQQIIPAAQLVPKFQGIGRCNNYVVLQSIPYSPECKIVGHILLDHPLSYALTATADVLAVYLQHFCKTVHKVSDTKDTIKFKLDMQDIMYTVDIFCDTIQLLVETTDNLFVAPINIEIIKSFMHTVGYQGVVDKTKINILQLFHVVVNQTNVDYVALLWWDIMNCVSQKKDVIEYPRFTKLILADLMKKFPSIPLRLEDDYHSIKDGNPLDICAIDDYKEYEKVVEGEKDEESYADKFVASMIHDDDFKDRIDPESHKGHPEVVVDDYDDNKEEKKYEKKDDEMGSLENRTEKMQTPIPTTPRSPRINLLSDKNIAQELMDTKVYGKVDQVLHEIVAQLAERATNDLIEGNLKRVVADTVIQERDAFQTDVSALISKEFDAQSPQIIEEIFKIYVQNNVIQVHPTTSTSNETTSLADLQQQSYSKIKSNLQDQANDPALLDVLKRKFEKSSTSNTSCRDDAFHSQRHDDHQEDVAPPKGEKRVKRHKTSKSSKSTRGSSLKQSAKDSTFYVTKQQQQQEWDAWEEETVVDKDEIISKDETPKLITEFQNINKRVPTIFDRARMEATLNDMLSNQFRNDEEYAYHLE